MPADTRSVVRNYTVRGYRAAASELDIDVVLHGDLGPGSRWAAGVTPGDRVGLLDQGTLYAPGDAPWQLLAADETGLPALAGIAERLPPGTRARAFVEVPSPDDRVALPTAGGDLDVTWLPRRPGDGPGDRLVAAVRAAALPAGMPYAWLAGESAAVTTIRRHLVADRGMDKRAVCFTGYWRRGVPADH
jgi:NADPH-dependent ferric siderophore reductase